MATFLWGWLKALRWQRLPEMEKLGDLLVKHFDGIAAFCDHHVRFGVVESLNTTIKGVIRRARGMRDETMLLLPAPSRSHHPASAPTSGSLSTLALARRAESHRRSRHVIRRRGICGSSFSFQCLRQTKVHYLRLAAPGDENICRLMSRCTMSLACAASSASAT